MPSHLIDRKTGTMDYFGKLSFGNLLDWMVTLCLGAILFFSTVSLGAVRPTTQLSLLPLYVALIVLHGLWLVVESESPKRISHIPLLFLPFLGFMILSNLWITPVPWNGWLELILAFKAFAFFWVFINNVRTRSHLWALFIIGLLPAAYAIFIGFFQFFQDPTMIANAETTYGVLLGLLEVPALYARIGASGVIQLAEEFLGKATGCFADPNSFAVFLLTLLPLLLIAGLVPRLPMILRVLCLYVAAMFLASLFLAQIFWPIVVILTVLLLIPWFAITSRSARWKFGVLSTLFLAIIVVPLFLFHPRFERSLDTALSPEGEGVRIVLWKETAQMFLDRPLLGSGPGSYELTFSQSPRTSISRTPERPLNEYLLVLSQYGVVGALLLFGPAAYIVRRVYRTWGSEQFRVRMKNERGTIMPPRKFFLSIGLAGMLAFGLCLFFYDVFHVPPLLLYGVLFFGVAIKSSFSRNLHLPESWLVRPAYLVFPAILAFALMEVASPSLRAAAEQSVARERFDRLIEDRAHLAGNDETLNSVIAGFRTATEIDPGNGDAWLGMSAAVCQLFYRSPAESERFAAEAKEYAERALELSDRSWPAWSQYGVALALAGDSEGAEQALSKALEMAPNSSETNYKWAAFLSYFPERHEEAIEAVSKALDINPGNSAARRLQQKLLIL